MEGGNPSRTRGGKLVIHPQFLYIRLVWAPDYIRSSHKDLTAIIIWSVCNSAGPAASGTAKTWSRLWRHTAPSISQPRSPHPLLASERPQAASYSFTHPSHAVLQQVYSFDIPCACSITDIPRYRLLAGEQRSATLVLHSSI